MGNPDPDWVLMAFDQYRHQNGFLNYLRQRRNSGKVVEDIALTGY